MKRICCLSSVLSLMLLFVSCGGPSRPVQWFEAETTFIIPEGLGKTAGKKGPASGGMALEGSPLGEPGRSVKAEITVARNIADANIVFKYARFHWNKRMVPARIVCAVTGPGYTESDTLTFDDTRGWGATAAADWRLNTHSLGALTKGVYKIVLTSVSAVSDVVLDGFFIAPAALELKADEFSALGRVAISEDGYIGIGLSTSTINQYTVKGFDVVARGFAGGKKQVTVELVGKDGTRALAFTEDRVLPLQDVPVRINITAEEIKKAADGNYTLKVSWAEGKQSLSMPFTVLGDLAKKAAAREKIIADYIPDLKGSRLATVRDDFRYMSEYIRQVLTVLAHRGGEQVDSIALESAKKYFWKNGQFKKTPAWKFAENLQGIIDQSDGVIANVRKGTPAYQGVYGIVRRAFVSKATGKLEEYQFYLPKSYNDKSKTPLLLRLAGNENMFQDTDNGISLDLLEDKGYVMAAPKANDSYWNDGFRNLVQLVSVMLQEYPGIDKKRVYCHGASAGGFGTFNLASRRPDLIAGIGCINGGVGIPEGRRKARALEANKRIPALKGMKIYIAQGKLDRIVPKKNADHFVAELEKLGYPHKYVVHDDLGHHLESSLYIKDMLEYFDR